MNATAATYRIAEWGAEYRHILLDQVIPFWLRYGVDEKYGGISNLLDEEGVTLGNDKYIWSQGRALWTFSTLCSEFEGPPRWRSFADHLYRYLKEIGCDAKGCWPYRLDKDRQLIDGPISIYVDGFVIAGLTAYVRLTGNQEALNLALATARSVQKRLANPGSYESAPYRIPAGTKAHGITMIFMWVFFELAKVSQNQALLDSAETLAGEVLDHFFVKKHNAILEYVDLAGMPLDTPAGHACVPGHALESLWFAASVFLHREDLKAAQQCFRLMTRHLELGWDEVDGGLFLALDIEGDSPFWQKADYKPWWVQVEALVATAIAWKNTGDSIYLFWHQRVREYALQHYPTPAGEWRQWLDRSGAPAASAALPVKDPFHLPRALMMLTKLLS